MKEFACVLNSGTMLECDLILIFMAVFIARREPACFQLGLYDTAALLGTVHSMRF